MKPAVLDIFESLFRDYPALEVCRESIKSAFEAGVACYENGGTVLVCGNGGSAADSEHIVGELMKVGFRERKLPVHDKSLFPKEIADRLEGALPAISLVSQAGLLTAALNDSGADMIFAQQVYGYRNTKALVLGISTSGNSQNVINAFKVAKGLEMQSLAFLGRDGGECAKIADISVIVPADITFKIQELHLPVYHAWCAMLEAHFFPLEEV